MTASIVYQGNLHCECTHLQSGSSLATDAPTDNQGQGAAFSPTDLVAVALASCILTTIGIRCRGTSINIEGTRAEVTKVMANDPRRIARIQIKMLMPAFVFTDKDKLLLEKIAHSCPVSLSLHPELDQEISFVWQS